MALTNATTLADYSSGIGTQGATLKVDANNQRVGIGTVTPTETLDVVGNMAVEGDISVTGTLSYEDLTNVDAIGLSTFRNGLHVTGGSVGLGTNNPTARLDVEGNQSDTDTVSGNTVFDIAHFNVSGATNQAVRFYHDDTNNVSYLHRTDNGGSLGFSLRNGGANAERVRITSGGNVGIGTDTPSTTLQVGGILRVGKNTADDAVLEIGGSNPTGNRNAFIDLTGDTTYTDYGLRIQRDNGGENTTSRLLHRGTGDFRFIAQEAASIEFWTTNAERVHINSGGDVNITGITTATQLFEGTTRVATSGKAIAMALIFG